MATGAIITVTGTLSDPSSNGLQGNAFVRFRLRNFQGFVPQVVNTSIICEIQIDALPNSSGQISQTLWANSYIVPNSTFYTVEFYNQGRLVSSGNYIFNGNTNLNTAAPINVPPVPPGFKLVLENNNTLNSSQSTLNLTSVNHTVTIADLGGGQIDLAASTSGGGVGFNGATHNLHSCVWFRGGSNAQNNAGFGLFGNTPTSTNNDATATIPNSVTWATNGSGQHIWFADTGADSQYQFTLGTVIVATVEGLCLSSSNCRYWIGALADTTASGASDLATDTPAVGFVGFRLSSSAGDTTFKCVATNGTTQTTLDSGVAPSTTAPQVFQIVPSLSGASVSFYINGALVATISTNLPANSLPVNWLAYFDNQGTSATTSFKFISISYETI